MTDEMLRKMIVLCALMVALDAEGERVSDLVSEEEGDAFNLLLTEAGEGVDTVPIMKTMLREHLADILAATKEVVE